MKKLLCAAVAVLFLSGCGFQVSFFNHNRLVQAELTPREQMLLNVIPGETFVYEYKVDKDFKSVNMIIEVYENGVKSEDLSYEMPTEIGPEGMLIYAISDVDYVVDNAMMYNLWAESSDGSGQGVSDAVIFRRDMALYSTNSCHYNNDVTVIDGKKIVLACKQWDRIDTQELSDEFLQDYESNLDIIEDTDLTFIIGCEFSTDDDAFIKLPSEQ